MITDMKKRSLGCPSSDNRNEGFANELKRWMRRAEEDTLRFLKYGEAFDNAITKAGYREVKEPAVVATIE